MLDKLSGTWSACMPWSVLAGLVALGCAHSPAPMRVRYADIDKGAMKGYSGAQPLIIEFQPGERIPVNFELTGDGFELEPRNPPMELVVKQHYFLQVGANGFRMSPDPEHLDDKPKQPGSFQIGFGVDPNKRARVSVKIATPRR